MRLTGPMKDITNSLPGLSYSVPGRAGLLDAPVVHDDDLLGDLHRLLLVVGDEDGRHVDLVVQPAQPLAQLGAHLRVERAEGLVEQQHLRLHGQRAGERHALHAGRRRAGTGSGRRGRRAARARAARRHAAADLVLGALADAEPEGHVVVDGHVLEGRVVLEDEADAACAGGRGGDVLVRRSRPRPRRGVSSPAMIRSSVDLPLPLGPEQRGQRAVGDGRG